MGAGYAMGIAILFRELSDWHRDPHHQHLLPFVGQPPTPHLNYGRREWVGGGLSVPVKVWRVVSDEPALATAFLGPDP